MTKSVTFEILNSLFDDLNTSVLLKQNIKKQFDDLIPLLFNYEEEGEK